MILLLQKLNIQVNGIYHIGGSIPFFAMTILGIVKNASSAEWLWGYRITYVGCVAAYGAAFLVCSSVWSYTLFYFKERRNRNEEKID